MTVNGQPLRHFLVFWKRITPPDELPEAERPVEFKTEWLGSTWDAIQNLEDEELDVLTEDWRRQYEEVAATQGSVDSRANGLLIVVGLLNGLAAAASSVVAGAWWPFVAGFCFLGALVVSSAVATATLALWSGGVRTWDRVHVPPAGAFDNSRSLRVRRAHEFYAGWRRNSIRVGDSVGYLRDAQTYALIAIVALALLAGDATGAALSRVPTPVVVPLQGPTVVATASPQVTISPMPSSLASPSSVATISPTAPTPIPPSGSGSAPAPTTP